MLKEKLKEANQTVEDVIETRNTLMKVVKSVSNLKKVKKLDPISSIGHSINQKAVHEVKNVN